MPWILFLTCLAQTFIALVVLSLPAAWFLYMVGAQVKRSYGKPTPPTPTNGGVMWAKKDQ